MELSLGILAIDLAIYLEKTQELIIADIHLGYEHHLAKKGILVPRTQYKETIKRLDYIFKQTGYVKNVILNGDVKHEFGVVNPQEWREVLRLFDYLHTKADEIIVVTGNHDTILGPITKKRDVHEVTEYRTGNILITHGDAEPKRLASTIIIGHEHPAISLREESKVEKYKCYLKGRYEGKTLIVQPSFLTLTSGTDVSSERLLSPLLANGVEDFECYIVNTQDHEIMQFGQVKNV